MFRAPKAWFLAVRLFAVILALSLSGASHAAQEAVEDVVHVATQGHAAHGAEHPEGRQLRGSEHDCFGVAHHCGCCGGSADCPDRVIRLVPPGIRKAGAPRIETRRRPGTADRIDRPPRA